MLAAVFVLAAVWMGGVSSRAEDGRNADGRASRGAAGKENGKGRANRREETVQIEHIEAEAVRQAQKVWKEDPKAAERILEERLAVRRAPAVLFQMGVFKARGGDEASAIALFREVLGVDPDFPGARKNLGRLLAASRRYEDAAEHLRKGIAVEGPDADSAAALGQCYLAMGKPAPAETAIRWAQVQKPDDPGLHAMLARALYEQGRFAECEAAARAALSADPLNETSWRLLANARVSGGRAAEAADALEALLLVRGADVPDVLWTLGDLYLTEGMPRPAASAYERALAAGKPPADRLRSMARAFLAAGDLARAERFAGLALETSPDDAVALIVKAHCARERGDIRTAKEAYARASAANPLCGEALLALGDIALEEKRYPEALAHYRSARCIAGFEEAALRAEADALLREERLAEAMDVLDRIRTIRPDPRVDALVREVRLRMRREAGTEAGP
ncbi:MAG: tetratricopeptide repeat protein [Planctomycetota bacterium]|nr:tetratricopeptide repeat protein [Planctomycetota bacterium]